MALTTSASRTTDGSRVLLASMHAPGERLETRVTSGSGVWLTLEDGRVVLDAGSMSSCILGHCHPDVVAAITKATGAAYCNDGTGYAPREQAADDIRRISFAGEDWVGAVMLTVSSSEAADLGLLLAQSLTGREPLVSRELSYHGGVGLAREISVHPLWGGHLASVDGGVSPRPFAAAPTRRLPVPECGISAVDADHVCAESCLRGAGESLAGAAAFMMDYTQGGVCPSAQYQDTLAAVAREAGTLWIADETVSAFGRLGHSFAFQRGSSRPDMVTLGKGITAGSVAGGALVLSRDIVEAIGDRRWMTASTYRGSPITVAAMSAVQSVLERDGIVAHANELGRQLGGELRQIGARHPSVTAVHGEGLMWHIRLGGDPRHDEETWQGDGDSMPLSQVVHDAALEVGVFIAIFGGNRLWIIPPLIVTAEQLGRVTDALDLALSAADESIEHR